MHTRWWEDKGWAQTAEAYFGHIPRLVRPVALKAIKKAARSQIEGHGMGRHSSAEIYQLGREDLTSISDFLADKPFMMGAEPTAIDATVFAFLHSIIDCTIESPLKVFAGDKKNLVDYTRRAEARFFGDG